MNETRYPYLRSSRGATDSLKNQFKALKISHSFNSKSSYSKFKRNQIKHSLDQHLKNDLNRYRLNKPNKINKLNEKEFNKSFKLIDNPVIFNHLEPIIQSLNKFSFDYYKHTSAHVPKNVAFSPFTLFQLLNLFNSCSDNKTNQDLKSILRLTKPDSEKYLPLLIDLINNKIESNENQDRVHVKCTATARDGFLLKEYADLLENNYGVELIQNSTFLKEKLKFLKDRNISQAENIFMLLKNKLDLKFSWKKEFLNLDEKVVFKKQNNQQVTIDLMTLPKQKFLYSKQPKDLPIKICEFPFMNDDYALTILLPDRNCMNGIESKLNNDFFNELLDEMKYIEVNSVLPKFKINDEFDLCNVIKSLGGETLIDYDKKRNGLCIDKAFYSSVINVDYDHVTISSETNIVLCREPCSIIKSKFDHPCEEFICENPFLFFIRNRSSKLILYMGKLMVPDSG